jgi:hypothetical protein
MFSLKTTKVAIGLAIATGCLAALASSATAATTASVSGRPGFFQPYKTQGELINFGNQYVNSGGGNPRVCASPGYNGTQVITIQWNLFKARSGEQSWTPVTSQARAVTVAAGTCVNVQFLSRVFVEYAWYTSNWQVWWQTPARVTIGYEVFQLDAPTDYELVGSQAYLGVTGYYLGRGAVYV